MGRNLGAVPFGGGGAGSPSNTMWPGPRPTCMPSFILIRQTVWPQYTNVTVRQTGQTDRQRSDSIRRTVLQTVAQKLKHSGYTVVHCNGKLRGLYNLYYSIGLIIPKLVHHSHALKGCRPKLSGMISFQTVHDVQHVLLR